MEISETSGRRMGSLAAARVGVVSAGAAGLAALGHATPARANVNIVTDYNYTDTATYPGSTSIASSPNAPQVEATINADIATLESYLANNVTVNVNFVNFPSGLGTSSTFFATVPYQRYRSDLISRQTTSASDGTALATLPIGTPNNPVNGNSQIGLTTPLLRALEGGTPNGSSPDSTIGLNLGITNTGRNGSTGADLQSTAAHELDEVLGIGGAGSALSATAANTGPVGPLDLFRYSGINTRSFDPSNTVSSYFSIDGGATDLVHFNQAGADGSDYSDWGNGITPAEQQGNSPAQVQDAFGGDAQPNLGPNELTALDVVGWNLTPLGTAVETGIAVPEPTSCALLALGSMGLLARRRRTLA